jgi:hypothetical protein
LLVIVAICGVAAVRIRRQPASHRMASGRDDGGQDRQQQRVESGGDTP